MTLQVRRQRNVNQCHVRGLLQHRPDKGGMEAASKIGHALAREGRMFPDLPRRKPDAKPIHRREPILLAERRAAYRVTTPW